MFNTARVGSRRLFLPALAVLLSSAVLACSGGNDPSADGGSGGQQEACDKGFLPLKSGLKWTYQVRDVSTGDIETKETIVEGLEPVPSKMSQMAFKVRTRKGASLADETVSWQHRDGQHMARYQEQSYRPSIGGAPPVETLLEWWQPYKLRIDESRLRQGDEWTVTYREFSRNAGIETPGRDRNERWKVLAVNESVTVPAGTYKALKLSRVGTDQNATSDKVYWFACGVGKVKEFGGKIEELTAVSGL